MNLMYYLTEGSPANNGLSPDGTLPAGAVECTLAQYQNPSAWAVSGGVMSAYTPPAPTLAQQAAALLGGGLGVTSTETAALNGTYAADPTTITYVNSELNAIFMNGTFADGTSTVEWPDVSGELHAFSIAQFKTLAAALGAFIAGIRQCIIGVTGATLPPATATIP